MKALLIGYGSIGKRHYEVLNELENINSIDIITKQSLSGYRTYKSLEEISNLDEYDYFIIASETAKHYEQLKYIEKEVSNKLIFCEKPLFKDLKELNIVNNSVFVGYVLRFHPLLEKLHSLVQNEKIVSINVFCGQYLPTWRPNTNYKDSYSAKKAKGGGALLDLSHEIDYVQWLCGALEEIKSYQVKISDLEIDSDDLTTFIGKTNKETMVNLSIDYISKIPTRKILLHTLNYTYELDLIKNRLIYRDKNGEETLLENKVLQRNEMFEKMHKDILGNKESVCSYKEAMEVMKSISKIQEQNR
jgi:CMP-N,N'-diacetyllegionaminic acid synthase